MSAKILGKLYVVHMTFFMNQANECAHTNFVSFDFVNNNNNNNNNNNDVFIFNDNMQNRGDRGESALFFSQLVVKEQFTS